MRNSIWRTVVATCFVAVLGALLPTTFAGAQSVESCAINIGEYEGDAILTVSPLEVAPGGTVTISGQGFPPGSTVPLAFNGEEFASPVTDEEGAFSITFTVPADIAPGVVTFTALCGAFTLTAELTVIVGGQEVTTTLANNGGLTPTGSNSTQLLQVAAALLAVGALLVFLARRQARRRVPVASV
jgi:hypothetical protein